MVNVVIPTTVKETEKYISGYFSLFSKIIIIILYLGEIFYFWYINYYPRNKLFIIIIKS